MTELIEKKKRLFKRVFGKKYSLKLIEMKVWDNKDGRKLAMASFVFGELMTALDIQVVCEKSLSGLVANCTAPSISIFLVTSLRLK